MVCAFTVNPIGLGDCCSELLFDKQKTKVVRRVLLTRAFRIPANSYRPRVVLELDHPNAVGIRIACSSGSAEW